MRGEKAQKPVHLRDAGAVNQMAAVALAAAAPSGATAPAADPGVSATQIVIGTTTPLTGPASPGYKDVAPAAQAYFNYVNANGGINGRKVEIRQDDDGYVPQRAVQGVKRLVEVEGIFGLIGTSGSAMLQAMLPWFSEAYGNPSSPYDDWLAFTNPANVMPVCRHCHDAIHADTRHAQFRGWLVFEGDPEWLELGARAWRNR